MLACAPVAFLSRDRVTSAARRAGPPRKRLFVAGTRGTCGRRQKKRWPQCRQPVAGNSRPGRPARPNLAMSLCPLSKSVEPLFRSFFVWVGAFSLCGDRKRRHRNREACPHLALAFTFFSSPPSPFEPTPQSRHPATKESGCVVVLERPEVDSEPLSSNQDRRYPTFSIVQVNIPPPFALSFSPVSYRRYSLPSCWRVRRAT